MIDRPAFPAFFDLPEIEEPKILSTPMYLCVVLDPESSGDRDYIERDYRSALDLIEAIGPVSGVFRVLDHKRRWALYVTFAEKRDAA